MNDEFERIWKESAIVYDTEYINKNLATEFSYPNPINLSDPVKWIL